VNFRGTETYESSHVAKRFSDDLIKPCKRGDIYRLEFAAKLPTDSTKNCMSAMLPQSCEHSRPPSKLNGLAPTEL
jgi:hypothetical protein